MTRLLGAVAGAVGAAAILGAADHPLPQFVDITRQAGIVFQHTNGASPDKHLVETMVGFAMYGRSPKDGRYFVVRLMIDARYIGKGYGKATMRALVDRMRRLPDCDEIYLSYVPGNVAAETLYLNLGFEKTGEIDEDGEIYMRLRLDGDSQGGTGRTG